MLWGYDLAVIGGAVLIIKKQFGLSSVMQEIVVSAALAGAMLGAALGGTLAEGWGRWRVFMLATVAALAGTVASALAPQAVWLIIGRAVTGAAFGMVAFVAPLHIAELAPADSRGKLVSLYTLAIMLGVLGSCLVDYACCPSESWRWMLGLGALPAALIIFGLWYLPESPRWLMTKARHSEARAVLTRLRGTESVEEEIIAIHQSLSQQHGTCAELFSQTVRPFLIIGICLAIIRQSTGVNISVLYAPTVFEMTGFESAASDILASVAVAAIFVVMTLVAMQLLDRWGRRPLLLMGLAGMVLSLALLGLAFQFSHLGHALQLIALISLMFFSAFWVLGPGSVVFLLIAEIFPLKIRSQAMSLATLALWSSYLIVSLTFLTLIELLGKPGTFWLFMLLALAAWIFTYFWVPETKGRSLEEIEREICGGGGQEA